MRLLFNVKGGLSCLFVVVLLFINGCAEESKIPTQTTVGTTPPNNQNTGSGPSTPNTGTPENYPSDNSKFFSVDSHFIHNPTLRPPRQGFVYVFNGSLSQDQLSGAADNAITKLPLRQTAPCAWGYAKPSLSPGTYTLALSFDDLTTVVTSQQFDLTSDVNANLSLVPKYVIHVGPTQKYKTPSELADALKSLPMLIDVVEIDAATYTDDAMRWELDDVTLRGVNGRPHIRYTRSDIDNTKGVWLIAAHNIRVENVEISGAKLSAPNGMNGAAIRFERTNLSLCQVYLHDSQNGFLGYGGALDIRYSEFDHNGLDNNLDTHSLTHNLYINYDSTSAPEYATKLVFKYNYTHRVYLGHNLKTRAGYNDIRYNRIMDEADGYSSYLLDIPNGGFAIVAGNIFQQAAATDNYYMMNYGTSQYQNSEQGLYVFNNTFVNDFAKGSVLQIGNPTTPSVVENNLIAGPARDAANLIANNVVTSAPLFANQAGYDYHLTANSPARDYSDVKDVMVSLPDGSTINAAPEAQYVYDSDGEVRPQNGQLDAGAFEY